MFRPSRLAITIFSLLAALSAHSAEVSADQQALHVLNRLGYGPKPGDIERVKQIGIASYIEQQLHPEAIPLPASLAVRLAALAVSDEKAAAALVEFPELGLPAKDGGDKTSERREAISRIEKQTAEARVIRAIDSPRQLEEVMVDFWFNHFNVYAGKGPDRVLVAGYERDAIRPYVLGSFRDLLGATAKHPAMLFYLDNWLSTYAGFVPDAAGPKPQAAGLNENYARQLMELHTMGPKSYAAQDVTELARIFTGWTFDPDELANNKHGFKFNPQRHDVGGKNWLGRHLSGAGQAEGELALDYLVMRPATARHIAYKLVQYFVQDAPSPDLVDRVGRRFFETGGDIRAVLQTLFSSPEFMAPSNIGAKFKTPYQFMISAARAADIPTQEVHAILDGLTEMGMPLYGCQAPEGYKNTKAAWLGHDAPAQRQAFAGVMASGLPLADGKTSVLDGKRLLATLAPGISERTRETIANAAAAKRAGMLLGSSDFMQH